MVITAFALFGVLGVLFLIGLGIALGRTAAENAKVSRQPVVVEFPTASRQRRAGRLNKGGTDRRQPAHVTIH
jgi:hypothetical protein